jgi:tetratricopeptide (TPR) repeat protein
MASVSHDLLEIVRRGVEEGLYLRAWEAAQRMGPLRSWRGTEARVLGGRLAMALGAPRLGVSLHLRAYRDEPDDAQALYYRARAVLATRGAYEALCFLRDRRLPASAPVEVRADWAALRGTVSTRFRDFDSAERFLAEAESICPDRPWILVERAALLEEQDRLEEALAVARRALTDATGLRPGAGMAARLLDRLGRFEEAVQLLREVDATLESASMAGHLAQLLLDLDRPREALLALDRYETLSPLLEPHGRAWVAGGRSDAAYALGDLEAARRHAEQAHGGFWSDLATRLAALPAGATPERRLLSVPFLQQQHLTCSPAALASLTAYWSRPVDQVALAAEIAYDGTPGHREREWAKANGWVAREFRLTAEAAVALLDRGVPFTLVTQYASTAHAQAVAGYDRTRGTLLIRDPSGPRLSETTLEPLLAGQSAHGPRCLALLPADAAARLDGVELPDEAAYDVYHALQLRLLAHDRAGAQALRDGLASAHPGHRLVHAMDARLAGYDSDPPPLLQAVERLLESGPADELLNLRRVDVLVDLGRDDEAAEALARIVRQGPVDPVFAVRYARIVSRDGRRAAEALRLLRRALRLPVPPAAALVTLAGLEWSSGRRPEALDAYRLAACAEIHNEGYVSAYVTAARWLGRAEEALAFLRGRVEGLGDRSAAPARALFEGLDELGRVEEGLASLTEALKRHPGDGELLLFTAEAEGRYGRLDRARELLAAAEGRSHHVDWTRTEARLALWSGDLPASLRAWRAAAEAEPLSIETQRSCASLLAKLEGDEAARAHLARMLARAPRHLGLHRLLVEWSRDEHDAGESALRSLLALHPDDAWSQRELALVLSELGRFAEAEEAAARALEIDPNAAATHGIRGGVLARAGRAKEAAEAFRRALSAAADYGYAIDGLVDASSGPEAKIEALRFVASELKRQGGGDGWFTLQRRGRLMDPAELVRILEAARDELPHVYQVRSALSDALVEQDRLAEAATVLAEATSRFPLAATLWLDAARLASLQMDSGRELRDLETAVAIAPGWGRPLVALAEFHQRHGRPDAALAPLRRAVALDPADSSLAARLAELLAHAGQKTEAVATLERALGLDPSRTAAWRTLDELAGAEEALALARRLVDARPRDTDALLALARLLAPPEHCAERLALLDRAIAIRPGLVDAHELRALTLSAAGRHPEALDACAPAVFRGDPPLVLRGRAAWVLAESGRRREAIAAMRDLLARQPDYYWGARTLADWAAESGTAQESLDASEHLVRLAPDDAASFGYRGDARLRAGDTDGGRTDLERALAIDPTYSYGSSRLFDVLLEESHADAASELLERLGVHWTAGQRSCRAVRIACVRGDVAQARELLTGRLAEGHMADPPLRAAVTAFQSHFGADGLERAAASARDGIHADTAGLLVEVLLEAGDRAGARRVLDALAGREEIEVAACRAWLELSRGEPGDRDVAERWRARAPSDPDALVTLGRTLVSEPPTARLALYEEALRLEPGHEIARDLRAAELANLGRIAEARAACAPLAGETVAPLGVRARAAWVEVTAGREAEGRRLMRALLKEDPFHRWGWDRLLEWGFRQKDKTQYLDDARRHAETFPGEPSAQGYLGDAYRRAGRRAEAEAAFRRSVELDPSYEWGRLALVDLLVDAQRAASAWPLLDVPDPSPDILLRRVKVALERQDQAAARRAFAALLRHDAATDDARRAARQAFVEAGGRESLEAAFTTAAHESPLSPAVVAHQVEWLGLEGRWRPCDQVLESHRGRKEALRAALAGYVRALRQRNEARRLRRLMKRERAALREDDFLWGLSGHALSLWDDRGTLRWLEDWRSRSTTPWVLNALAIALRRAGRLPEALEVSRHARTLPRDHVSDCHRVWLGIEEALTGDVSEAERLVKDVQPPDDVQDFYLGLARLAEAVVAMRRGVGQDLAGAFREARALVAQADHRAGRQNRDYTPLRHRARLAIARARGFWGWLWLVSG